MLSSGRRRGAVEWRIYHGLKWCLRLTKVLIIQSEEELPGHYLPENNNVNTRLLGLSRCILSELVSCSTIHSISNRPACPRIHSPSRRPPPSPSPPPPPPHFNFALRYLPVSRRLHPPPSLPGSANPLLLPAHFLLFLRGGCGGCSTPPPLHPYLVLMSHCEIQADGWGTKG